MKHIEKHTEPQGIVFAREHHLTWDEFDTPQYKMMYIQCREQAYDEQSGECAYTGMPLNKSAVVHLDHFRKKSIYPLLTFDWSNLFAAVKDNHYGSDYKDNQINGTNAAHYYQLLINPAIESPEAYFWYSNDGKVHPKAGLTPTDFEKANTTIRLFNLNQSTLINRRRDLWQILQSYQDLSTEVIASALKNYGFSFVISNYQS